MRDNTSPLRLGAPLHRSGDTVRGGVFYFYRPSRLTLLLALLCLTCAVSGAHAQTSPILPPPTLIPAPVEGLPFEMARLSVGADDAEALLAEDVTGGLIGVRAADFVYPDGADVTFGGRIERLHEQGLKVLLRIESEQPPLTHFEELLNFIARLAALHPDAMQIEDRLNLNVIPPELYVGLMRQAFGLIKRIDPAILVISGGLVDGDPADELFGESDAEAGTADCSSGTCLAAVYRAALADAGLSRFADCIGVRYDAGTPLAGDNLALSFNPFAARFPAKPLCLSLANLTDATVPDEMIRAARESGRVLLLILEDTP